MTKKKNVSRKLLAKLDGTCGGNFDKTSRASRACEWLFLSSEKIKSRLQKNWRRPKIRDFTEAWCSPQVPCYKYSVTKKSINPKPTFSSIEEIHDRIIEFSENKKSPTKKSAGEIKTVCNVQINANKFLSNNATSDRQKKPFWCLFFSFASIVTGGPVTQIWATPNPMFQEKKFLEQSEKGFFLKEHKGNLFPHSWSAQ